MIVFEHNEPFDSPRAEVWAWRARPGAFRRLAPPWQDVRPVSEPAAIEDGSRILGLGRLLRLPAPLARLVRGNLEDPAFLTSTRAVPARLVESGYRFRHTDVEQALRHLLGRHGGAERP